MRHGKKILKMGRNASHRKATLQSMSAALIEHKRITTTLGKARALRRFVEPILHKAKDDSTHSRRQAFRRLQDKESVKRLYSDIADVIGDRPGGYTRVVKIGQRNGDAAEMAIIELVDFNDVRPDGASTKKKTRRSRRSGGTAKAAPAAAAAPVAEAEAPVVDEAPAEEAAPEAVETPEADDAPEAVTEEVEDKPADAVAPSGDDHPDAEQGETTGTGEPGPGADAENMGRSHDAR